MVEKRFKVAVYDEKAINGFTVLDLHKPNSSKRLKYENVYIGSKEGCDIVCKFGNELAEENEQLKTKNNAYLQDIEMFKEENTTLKLENEQLKEENQKLMKSLGESGRVAVEMLLPTDEDNLTLNGKWW